MLRVKIEENVGVAEDGETVAVVPAGTPESVSVMLLASAPEASVAVTLALVVWAVLPNETAEGETESVKSNGENTVKV
jgi:hypothetical protein